MIKLPFFQRKKDKRFVSLDIGTEAAKILFFSTNEEKEKGRIVNILGSALHYFDGYGALDGYSELYSIYRPWRYNFDEKVIKKTLAGAIKEACSDFQRVTGKEIKDKANLLTVISLPAHIIKSRIIFQSFKRKKIKDVIDRKEERLVRQTVLENARVKVSQTFYQESGILPKDIHFIALKVLETKIDGYEVPLLQGYDGKNLNFRILAIFLPAGYLKTVENIANSLGLRNTKIVHSAESFLRFPYFEQSEKQGSRRGSYFEQSEKQGSRRGSYLSKKPDGIFLDIGGNLTQIFLVNCGKLEWVEEFEMGGGAFSRSLSQRLDLNIKSARVLKENYCKRVLSEEVRKRIKEIFLQPLAEWFNNLKLKLLTRKSFLPSTFFLFGGGSLLPDIQEILEGGNWEEVPIISLPQAQFIYPKDLPNIVDNTNRLNSPKDISPILICYNAK